MPLAPKSFPYLLDKALTNYGPWAKLAYDLFGYRPQAKNGFKTSKGF